MYAISWKVHVAHTCDQAAFSRNSSLGRDGAFTPIDRSNTAHRYACIHEPNACVPKRA